MPTAKKNTITKHSTMAQAVAAAQLQMTNALKDAKNPHFKSNFASLPVVRDIVIPAYAANGVSVIQSVIGMDGYAGVKTTLYWQGDPDKPREQMDAGDLMMPIGNVRNVAQAVGSIVSYCRRYMLAAAGGIGQVDDDGNSADAIPQHGDKRRPATAKKAEPKALFKHGDIVKTANGNVGSIFWIGTGDKAGRVGVKYGDGKDEKEFTSQSHVKAVEPIGSNDGKSSKQHWQGNENDELPF